MAEVFQSESRAGEEGSSERRVARVYAEALLDVASERNQAEEIGAELRGIINEVYSQDPEIEKSLSSPVVKRTAKAPILEHAFKGRVSDLIFDFLNVLNSKDRLILVRHAAAAYRDLLDERAKRVRVVVRSAVPLSDELANQIKSAIANATGLDPVIVSRIEPELLGGMIIQIGDHVYDSSVRNRIEAIRTQLLARSNYEIQTGRDRFSHPG